MKFIPYDEAVTERGNAEVRVLVAQSNHEDVVDDIRLQLATDDIDDLWDTLVYGNADLAEAKVELYAALEWYGEIMWVINIGEGR